jgi:DHA1 family bicyclomycin/chloramphenicol resistance-like MFS transporter
VPGRQVSVKRMSPSGRAAPLASRRMARTPRAPSHAQLVVLLGALSAFGPLSMDMYLPGLPSMAGDLSAPAWAAQLTITTSMLGLAGGQLIAGPISDSLGRRRPLLAGVAAYMVMSVLCAMAPTIWALLGFRLVQGAAGAAGIVIARAIVRDLHTGVAAARFFALLMLVGGLAPILAPLAGGQLLHVTDWRGIFVVLAAIGAVLLISAWWMLGETLPGERRHGGGLVQTVHVFGALLRDRPFMGYTLSAGLVFGAMATYISGSPFVLQDIHGVSPQLFSLLFAVNAGGILLASQTSRALVARYGPQRMLTAGVLMGVTGGLGVLVSVLADLGLAGLLPSLFVTVSSVGMVIPNAAALALADHPRTAGSASALLGLTQFATGALAAPLAGVGGSHTALPMAIVMATLPLAGLACLLGLAGRQRTAKPPAAREAASDRPAPQSTP